MAGDVPGRWRNRSRNAGHAALLGAGLAGVLTFWRCTRKLAAAETDLDDLAAERKRWQRSVRRNAFETLLAAGFFAGALEIIANIRQLFAAIDRSTKSHSLILRHPHIHWDAGISSADAAVVITAMVLLVATLNVAVASTNLEDARPWSLNQVSRTLWAESLTSVARLAAGVAGGIAISSWWGQGFGPAFVFSWMAVSAVVVTAAIQQRNKDDGLSALRQRELQDEVDKLDRRIEAERSRGITAGTRLRRSVRYVLYILVLIALEVILIYAHHFVIGSASPLAYILLDSLTVLAFVFCVTVPMTYLLAIAYAYRNGTTNELGNPKWIGRTAIGICTAWSALFAAFCIYGYSDTHSLVWLTVFLVVCGAPAILILIAWRRGKGPGRIVMQSCLARWEATRSNHLRTLRRRALLLGTASATSAAGGAGVGRMRRAGAGGVRGAVVESDSGGDSGDAEPG